MWKYDISSGQLSRNGKLVLTGYSGKKGRWRNNPETCHEVAKGPLPPGRYKIGKPFDSGKTGKGAMPLTPMGHDALGRSAFQIHGDNKAGDASTGCIIANGLPVRLAIWNTGDHELEVVA